MKKVYYLIVLIAIFGLIVSGCIPVVPPAEQGDLSTLTKSGPGVVWVNISGPDNGYDRFDTIQEGVDAVSDYGTVYVANGMYNATTTNSTEWPGHPDEWWFVTINKPLELVGESRDGVILDGTALQGHSRCTGIWVSASNVTIKNLTLQNFTQTSITAACYALYVMEKFRDYTWGNVATLENVTAENVKAADNMYAFYFMKTTNATIKECISENNLGDGIWVAWGCDSATIQDNIIINSGDHGIWVGKTWFGGTGSNNATIIDNYVDGAREGGISFVGSDVAIISGNTITNAAGDGWSVGALSLKDGPSNVEAFDNNIYNNSGIWSAYNGTGHGIGIDGTPSNIYLHHNNIYDNTGYGIYNYSTVTINATCNWWGDASGPNGEGSGTGDEVSSYVDFDPWLGDVPVIDSILINPLPAAQSETIYLTAFFNGPTGGTATIDWGDGSILASGEVNDSEGTVTGSYIYPSAGVYTVTVELTITNDCTSSDTKEFSYAVVHDPFEGFVSGGGWINSPVGASFLYPLAEGKAIFGFVSKYKKGQSIPTGNTEFQFKAGDLNFHSDSYDWLVIAHHKAMYKGTGTINGTGEYGFMLSAIDEKLTPSNDIDMFRIKIWDKGTDILIYDNQMGDVDNADPTTEIGGGQIVIHTGK